MLDNPFSILNINQNASIQEIKSAYRKLSMIHHPDRNGNCELFQKVNAAYKSILSNSQSLHSYSQSTNSPHTNSPHTNSSHTNSPHTINNKHTDTHHQNNHDYNLPDNTPPHIVLHLEVDFQKIYSGTSLPILVTRWIIEGPVKRHETETIYLHIPKGTDDNEIFTIKEKGHVLTTNIIGDVKVFIKIKNDTLFFRQGLDIIYKKDISLKDALCGFSFDLEFIDGKCYKINNKSGNILYPNYKKTINNMGFDRKDIMGNLVIQFNIIFPKTLSLEQCKRLESIL